MRSISMKTCLILLVSIFILVGFTNAQKKKVKCHDKKIFPYCTQTFTCPSACPHRCFVDCKTCHVVSLVCDCDKPGSICQDPRFIGGDGITFYFHGKKDRDFCLVADTNLHINGHFIGKRNPSMKRDFTWVQSLGILFDDHQLYVGAMKTATWSDEVDRLEITFDGQPVYIPQYDGAVWTSESASVTITRLQETNGVEIEAKEKMKMKAVVVPITHKDSLIHNYGVTDDDCMAHLDLSFNFYSLSETVNGVLGQTYAEGYVSRAKLNVPMPVLGGEKEFSSSGIFSVDCSVAKFTGFQSRQLGLAHLAADLTCATGVAGNEVVCKR